jgi:hypothetical protein
MVEPTTKAPSKKAFHFPKTAKSEPPAKLSKRKAASAAVADATETQVKAVKASRSKTNLATPSNAPAENTKRPKKEKVIRDSFTMPKSDYEQLSALKQKCLENGVTVKKSELLRAGLLILASATAGQLISAVAAVETVKTGRPTNT